MISAPHASRRSRYSAACSGAMRYAPYSTWPFGPMANSTAEINRQPTTRLSCAYHGSKVPRSTSRRTPAFAAAKSAAKTRMNHGEIVAMPASLTPISSAIPKPTNPLRGTVDDQLIAGPRVAQRITHLSEVLSDISKEDVSRELILDLEPGNVRRREPAAV